MLIQKLTNRVLEKFIAEFQEPKNMNNLKKKCIKSYDKLYI